MNQPQIYEAEWQYDYFTDIRRWCPIGSTLTCTLIYARPYYAVLKTKEGIKCYLRKQLVLCSTRITDLSVLLSSDVEYKCTVMGYNLEDVYGSKSLLVSLVLNNGHNEPYSDTKPEPLTLGKLAEELGKPAHALANTLLQVGLADHRLRESEILTTEQEARLRNGKSMKDKNLEELDLNSRPSTPITSEQVNPELVTTGQVSLGKLAEELGKPAHALANTLLQVGLADHRLSESETLTADQEARLRNGKPKKKKKTEIQN